MVKLRKEDLFCLGGLILLVAIFFHDVLFGGRSYWYRDIIRYLYPNRLLAAEMISQGQFPLWNPYLFCGLPLFANFQNGLIHPLSAAYYLFPFYLSFKYFIVCQFWLGAVGAYLFLRSLKLSLYACFIGAMVFVFCGPLLATINIFPILQSVVWLPLVYVFFVAAIKRKSLWFAALISLTMAMQLFGGQPEILLIDLLIMAALTIYYRQEPGRLFKIWLVSLGGLLLVTAVQLLPFAEFVRHSQRQEGLKFLQVTDFSLHPLELLGFIMPNFSLFWQQVNIGTSDNFSAGFFLKNLNLGLVPLLLLMFSCTRKTDRRFIFFALLGSLSILIAFGKYFFLYRMLYDYVPGLSFFRYPVKFLFLGLLPLAVLCAIGVEAVEERIRRGQMAYFIGITALLAGLLLLILPFLELHREYFEQAFVANIKNALKRDSLYGSFLLWAHQLFLLLIRDLWRTAAFLLATGGVFWLAVKRKLDRTWSQALLAILVLASLWLPSLQKESTISDEVMREQPSGLKARLIRDHDHFRMFLPVSTGTMVEQTIVSHITDFLPVYLNVLFENTGQVGHLSYVDGYEPLKTVYFANLITLLSTQPSPSTTSLLNLLNVKYVVSLKDIADPTLVLDQNENGVRLYRNIKFQPRVLIVKESLIAASEREIYQRFLDKKFDPARTVILEDPAAPVGTSGPGKASLVSYDNQEVKVAADLENKGWLLLADGYYPGWRVFIDDRPAKIYKADYALRAVPVPAGKHLVKFIYQPGSFLLGLVVTAGAFLLMSLSAVNRLGKIHV